MASMISPRIERFPFGSSPTSNNTGSSMPGATPLPSQPPAQKLFRQGANNQAYGAQAPTQAIAPAAPLPKPAAPAPRPQMMAAQAAQAAPPAPQPATAPAQGGYTPDAMRNQIGGNIMGLLGGQNAAADMADTRAMTQLNQMQKSADAGLGRQAAAMGIQPGDPRYNAFLAQNQGAQQAFGSRVLGENAQRRLEDQNRSLQTAVSFNQGQQTHDLNQAKFGEDTRRYDQDFGESKRRDDRNFGEDTRRYDQDFGEDTRRFNVGQGNNERDFGEDVRRDNRDFGEGTRRFDVGQGNVDRAFGEDVRRDNRDFGEDTRRFDVGQGNIDREFGEGTRRFDVGQGNIDREFGEDTRRFDVGQDNFNREFGEDTRRFDVGQGNVDREFGENTRQFNETFGENRRQFDTNTASQAQEREVNTLFDIINNPLSSEGQVEAAKQQLLKTQGGLDPTLFNQAEKTGAQREFEEHKQRLAVMNPGMSEEELDKLARARMGTLDDAAFGAIGKANGVDAPAPAGTSKSFVDKLIDPRGPVADTYDLATGGAVSTAKGIGHTIGEAGRGFGDILDGDILGGAGRIVSAPIKGVGSAVANTGRSVKRTFNRLFG